MNRETSLRQSGTHVGDAIDAGADCLVTPCPLCHLNLDMQQPEAAKVVNRDVVDVVNGNGPHRGYATLSKDDGEVVVKWSGDVATMMAKDRPPLISFRGTWQYVSGTGKYQGIQGRGTYSGHFTSQTEYVADWIGQYTLPVAGR